MEKIFTNYYIKAMQKLRSDGYTPMSVEDIAKKKLEVLVSGNKREISKSWDIQFDTSSAIAYFKDEIKVIPNCELLVNIDSDAELKGGALVLTED